VRFLNPPFPSRSPKGRERRWWTVRRLIAEQQEIHFKMVGAEAGQESAMEEEWASSHDFTNTFTKMLVDEEYVPYLAFSPRGGYYAGAARPGGVSIMPMRHLLSAVRRYIGQTERGERVSWRELAAFIG
jgi:hypothetical protein